MNGTVNRIIMTDR